MSESPPVSVNGGPVDGGSLNAVALGGGHGLSAALTALRLISTELTAIVTVADDGGSSGRIRQELPVLPPGDLRMAIAALAGSRAQDAFWARTLQHRLGGSGGLAGHPVGNLLLTGLMDNGASAQDAIARVADLVGAVGRVLPMSPIPLDLIAEVDGFDPEEPDLVRRIRGQVSIATTPGRVRQVRLLPAGAPSCAAAVDAVRDADLVVLGPGSWFTSVIPHLLLRELGHALATTKATVVVTLNLVPQAGETDGFSPEEHLRVLRAHARPPQELRIDAVVADVTAVLDPQSLQAYARQIGSRLILSDIADGENADRHDPGRLSAAFQCALDGRGSGMGADQRWR